jgi:methionine sulfoxide reductase heme-binding subunit
VLVASTAAWYAARAGGMVAFALLTVGVLFGLVLSGRARSAEWPRFAVEDVHRFVGLLAGTFVAIHVLVLLLQSYVPFSLADLVVPFAASWKPIPTALGVVGMELMVALALTNRFRSELPYRFWRRAHYLNFAVWLFALVHGIASGTDTSSLWGAALYAASGGAVVGLTVWRFARGRALEPWALRLWPGTAGLLAAELLVAVALVR